MKRSAVEKCSNLHFDLARVVASYLSNYLWYNHLLLLNCDFLVAVEA
jgi:hypothetical protein